MPPIDGLPRPLALAPFSEWTYEDAVRELRRQLPANYNRLKDYAVDKNHFRRGEEWVGPGDGVSNKKIGDQFAPEDAIGEVLSNVANAFAEPQIGAKPRTFYPEGTPIPEEVQQRMAEGVALLAVWWDKNRLQEKIQNRQEVAAWTGLSGLRLRILRRFLMVGTDGRITIRNTDSIEEALSFIRLHDPLPDRMALIEDSSTGDTVSVYLDTEIIGSGEQAREVHRAELVYLDPNRQNDEDADTILRIVYANNERTAREVRLPLKGKLLYSEMRALKLITDPVLRAQQQLNFITTILTRLAETASFRERFIKNAVPQGYRIPYEDGDTLPEGAFLDRDEEGRQWVVIPTPRTLGANTTNELVGLPQYDDKGDRKGFQMPDVTIADPVDPKPYIEAAESVRRRILRMCSQGHLGGISNAEASGIAYEQARAVFEKDLNRRRVPEEGMLRDILEAALTLAELISGKDGYYTDVMTITVDQHIDPGPRSPDLVRLDLEAHETGVLSWETTATKLGVEDLDAERIRIRRSAAHILDVLEKATKLSTGFTPESIIEVLKQLNLPSEIIQLLEPAQQGGTDNADAGGAQSGDRAGTRGREPRTGDA